MKAVMISQKRDFAGSGYEIAQAIKQQGVDITQMVFSVSKHKHPYDMLVTPQNWSKAQQLIYEADVIHFKGDALPEEFFSVFNEPESPTIHIPNSKPWVILLGGSGFRRPAPKLPKNCSFAYHPIEEYVKRTAFRGVITPDLNYTALNGRYTPHALPDYPYMFQRKKKFVIGHSPSNPTKKGSKLIEQAINELRRKRKDFEFRYIKNVMYYEGLERKSRCSIYIDQLTEIGIYAKAAVECLMMGIPCVAYIKKEVTAKSNGIYQKSPVQSPRALHPKEIARVLNNMMNWRYLRDLSIQSKLFANNYHSYEAVGKLWVKQYEEAISDYKQES